MQSFQYWNASWQDTNEAQTLKLYLDKEDENIQEEKKHTQKSLGYFIFHVRTA